MKVEEDGAEASQRNVALGFLERRMFGTEEERRKRRTEA